MRLRVAIFLALFSAAAAAADWGNLLQGLQVLVPNPSQPASTTSVSGNVAPAALLVKSLTSGSTTVEEERQIGAQIAGNLLGVAPLVNDAALQRYVNRVGRWVALQSERPDLVWHFGVVETDDINAFAAPGGYVMLTKGLYRQLKNEAELAGVLGHEIGHVVKKHHLKLLRESQMVGGIGGLLGQNVKGNNPLVQNLIGNGAEIVARGLDKDSEFEADRIGMVLSARAGYDAYGLPSVLQAIGHVALNDNRMALLYKTHPHPDVRLTRLGESVTDHFDRLEAGKTLDNRFYRLR